MTGKQRELETASLQLDDGLATVTMNRPDRRNAFTGGMVRDLSELFRALVDEPACRCIVLTGEGSAFSAGADIDYMREMKRAGEAENVEDAKALADLLHLIYTHRKPVIAKVNGAAIGGGLGLVAACDIAIGSRGCKFAFSEVRLGIVPAVIAPYVVKAIGEKKARRYMLTGDVFHDEDAVKLGLLEASVAPVDLDKAVQRLAESTFATAPSAVAECKELIRRVAVRPADEVRDYTARLIARLRTGEEGQEGMAAFLEKRAPAWLDEE
ncbi:MAG: Hydroxycinnamoyl-CoA hydratase-lyase [Calditrichaeota bacterium]|nr:Hydroxycinnamoyl-CoA hydratase-lyase [Calditrichota bacterium]